MTTTVLPYEPTVGRVLELAVFDIAGTTVDEDNAVYRALEEAVIAVGCAPTPADIARWMGADKTEAITALIADRDDAIPGHDEVRVVYDDFRGRLRRAYEDRPPVPLPGVEKTIVSLREAGIKVVLTTGFSREVTDDLLATLGWDRDVVDSVVCAEEVGVGRPAPYMIFEAMRRTSVLDVRRVLVAGDTVLDLLAGTNSGAGEVVGVLSGAMSEEALMAAPHTRLLASVAEIPDLFL